ncbi:hypothetical protein [Myroides odoratus]|uniref:hypothetical protein n=1 Tax=Myroides odoratus TaxID=256 RepID=UPI00076587AC|nr:hypothetical protein [Myroides odoratus]
MYKTLLYSLVILCSGTLSCFGQKTFKDTHQLLWVKGVDAPNSSTGFNYHAPILFSGEFPVLNKKFTSSTFSYVFYVVKTTKGGEKLFSLYDSDELHTFYTDVIKSNSEVKVDLSYLNQGAIVNFNFYNKNYKKGKSKGIMYLDNTYDKTTTALYEVLICNDCSTTLKRDQIDTYLGLKYGITLGDKSKYWSSQEVKVWDEKQDSSFNNRIIGLAKDRYFGLNQTATKSNVELAVAFKKSDATTRLEDQTYVLIGDNGKEKTFDSQNNRFKRQWLVQNKGEHALTFDMEVGVQPEKDETYVLYTSQGGEIAYDKQDTVNLRFANITVSPQSHTYLSIGRVKPFKIDIQQDTLGINRLYKLGMNEVGEPPFYIQARDLQTQETHAFISESTSFPLVGLPSATYALSVQDTQGQQADIASVVLDFSETDQLSLASSWALQGRDLIEIKPQIKSKNKQYGYRWYLEDKLISTAPVLRVNYPGTFSLEVTDVRGKSQRFGFTVDKQIKTTMGVEEQWLVTPNPVKAGEEFTVHYDFASAKQVDFYIYTLEGKFIQRKKLGLIEGGQYTYRLASRTTYLLVSIINNKTSFQTLIVK